MIGVLAVHTREQHILRIYIFPFLIHYVVTVLFGCIGLLLTAVGIALELGYRSII